MRKFIYIVFAAALFASSCEQEQPVVDPGNGELPIFNGYMQFSTEVSTRAKLATDMKGKAFGVIGYEYSSTSSWSGAKSTTTPNAFYNQRVDCDANNGTCQYDSENPSKAGNKPKPWGDYRYAFFAYHPFNGAGITLSGEDVTNTPTLTYTYGWLNPSGNPDWLYTKDLDGDKNNETVIDLTNTNAPVFDLMTAESVDATGKGSGRVELDFKHRMFAIEILANNYNENIYKYAKDADGNFILDKDGNKTYELDANGEKIIADPYYQKNENGDLVLDDAGNPILVQTNARQKISNLTLTLEGLRKTTMTIPLSMKSDEDDPIYSDGTVGTRHFKISSDMVEIPAFNEITDDGRGEGVATSISGSGNGGYLMLIPQLGTNEGITGTLRWDQLPDFIEDNGGEEGVSNVFNSTIDFEPGKLYQVYINFVGDGITIALIAAGNWDTHNVTHTFE